MEKRREAVDGRQVCNGDEKEMRDDEKLDVCPAYADE
jgi:hypothetical protein